LVCEITAHLGRERDLANPATEFDAQPAKLSRQARHFRRAFRLLGQLLVATAYLSQSLDRRQKFRKSLFKITALVFGSDVVEIRIRCVYEMAYREFALLEHHH